MSFKFFSGFSLADEEKLFDEYLTCNDFTVAGFSYGAIKAFQEVLHTSFRVDTLQLFSPAFFQTQDKKFKRMQLMFFKKDASAYCKNFLKNITYPSSFDMLDYFNEGTFEELDELLNYEWLDSELQKVVNKGIKIEVYLGANDKIINAKAAMDFFKTYATVYFIKDTGHILKN